MADEIRFEGENPNEKILTVIRRHPWTMMRAGLGIVLLLLVLTAVFLVYQGSWLTSWAIFLMIPLALILGGRAWFVWSNSVMVLTNERVIVVNQLGWFTRQVVEVSLNDIMTLSHDIQGPVATLLNFGDVNIQASGASDKDISIRSVYDPYEVQQRIARSKREDNHKYR